MTMTFDQAMEIVKGTIPGYCSRTRDPAVLEQARAVVARGRDVGATRPVPYQALCVCGSRYGAHRVNDYACPNREWRPGNGRPQWLTQVFARAI